MTNQTRKQYFGFGELPNYFYNITKQCRFQRNALEGTIFQEEAYTRRVYIGFIRIFTLTQHFR